MQPKFVFGLGVIKICFLIWCPLLSMSNINFNFIDWNIRGLDDPIKCDTVFAELCTLKPSIVFFQETKLDIVPHSKA